MAFSPGQFITAQRLNRLQTKVYQASASAAITTVSSGNVAGTAMSITTETAGATAFCSWSMACYATNPMTGNTNTLAKYDLASATMFALAQQSANGDKVVSTNFWVTTVAAAGTYTFQLAYTNVANSQIQIYTTLVVQIMEVA